MAGVSPTTLYRRARIEGWGVAADPSADPTASARALYADLSTALRGAIDALRDITAGEGAKAARDRLSLIRAHQKALQTLLDFESRHEKRCAAMLPAAKAPAGGGFRFIDLDAARAEVGRRLARLAIGPED